MSTKVTFSGEGTKENRFIVDDDGMIYAWDSCAGHYTLAHSLTQAAQKKIRALAAVHPMIIPLDRWLPNWAELGYSLARALEIAERCEAEARQGEAWTDTLSRVSREVNDEKALQDREAREET